MKPGFDQKYVNEKIDEMKKIIKTDWFIKIENDTFNSLVTSLFDKLEKNKIPFAIVPALVRAIGIGYANYAEMFMNQEMHKAKNKISDDEFEKIKEMVNDSLKRDMN